MSHTALRARAPFLLASAGVVLMAILGAGCDKAKEEPVGHAATVVMPAAPAPSGSDPSSSSAATVASTSADLPPGITAGNSGPPAGGTVSVIPGAPAPVAATPPSTVAPRASPLDPSALPPAIAASRADAGAIGLPASAPADDQPPSVAPDNDQPRSVPPGSKS